MPLAKNGGESNVIAGVIPLNTIDEIAGSRKISEFTGEVYACTSTEYRIADL
jgi:hypothetical protein